jgi:hypothetical protein
MIFLCLEGHCGLVVAERYLGCNVPHPVFWRHACRSAERLLLLDLGILTDALLGNVVVFG